MLNVGNEKTISGIVSSVSIVPSTHNPPACASNATRRISANCCCGINPRSYFSQNTIFTPIIPGHDNNRMPSCVDPKSLKHFFDKRRCLLFTLKPANPNRFSMVAHTFEISIHDLIICYRISKERMYPCIYIVPSFLEDLLINPCAVRERVSDQRQL